MTKSIFQKQAVQAFSNYRWVLHLVFWGGLFAAYQLSFPSNEYIVKMGYTKNLLVTSFVIRFTTFIGVSYSFLFVVVPSFKNPENRSYWLLLIGVILSWYLLQTILLTTVLSSADSSKAGVDNSFTSIFSRHYSNYLIVLCIFIAFYYFVDIYDQQKGLKQLEQYKTEKISLESSFLKSQVNPHFLFNTLNNIYALSMKKSTETKVIIERLESLLHYMLFECKADLVPLENEFTFTDSYIALEKLRHKEDQCTVTVEITGDASHKKIAPLLLINFLENAFKHGTKTSFGKSWINLEIDIADDQIHFRLQNSKPFNAVGQAISDYKGGIGLKNVQRRLEILYPQRHVLTINNLKDRFEVDLSIIL